MAVNEMFPLVTIIRNTLHEHIKFEVTRAQSIRSIVLPPNSEINKKTARRAT
jgi:hypothetical protein